MAKRLFSIAVLLFSPSLIFAGEQNLKIPTLSGSQSEILIWGLLVCIIGMGFGFYQFLKIKKLRAHKSMLNVAGIIFETCKTYLLQQGKLLIVLFLFIAVCVAFYFGYLQQGVFHPALTAFLPTGNITPGLLPSRMRELHMGMKYPL